MLRNTFYSDAFGASFSWFFSLSDFCESYQTVKAKKIKIESSIFVYHPSGLGSIIQFYEMKILLTFLVNWCLLLLFSLFNCHLYQRLDLVHHVEHGPRLCRPVFGLLFNDRVIFTITVIHFIIAAELGLSYVWSAVRYCALLKTSVQFVMCNVCVFAKAFLSVSTCSDKSVSAVWGPCLNLSGRCCSPPWCRTAPGRGSAPGRLSQHPRPHPRPQQFFVIWNTKKVIKSCKVE